MCIYILIENGTVTVLNISTSLVSSLVFSTQNQPLHAIGQVLTFACTLAYEANVALEYPAELFCLPGDNGQDCGRGQLLWQSSTKKGSSTGRSGEFR